MTGISIAGYPLFPAPMLDKFFTKPLELQVGGKILKFNSEVDFEFSMAGRTAIPSAKISDLLKLSVEGLKKEEQAVINTRDSFYSILSQAIEDPNTIDRALRELDTLVLSQDHDWRDLIKALNENDEKFNPLRMIALAKYLKYLTALKDTVAYILVEKESPPESTFAEGEKQNPEFAATWTPGRMPDAAVIAENKEDTLERLPRGEAMKIILTPGTPLDLYLSDYKCRLLVSDNKILFIDKAGGETVLGAGRNIIGRGADSVVKFDAAPREISRTHVLIYNEDNKNIYLTDLSSGGTFIPREEFKRLIC